MDKSRANKSAIDYVNSFLALLSVVMNKPFQILVRQIKYLNNIVEADHRFVKKLTKPMLGFKAFHSADATIAGIELHHMLKKGQHRAANNVSRIVANVKLLQKIIIYHFGKEAIEIYGLPPDFEKPIYNKNQKNLVRWSGM